MGKSLDYYDYAEDGYKCLQKCIKSGIYYNALASLAQNTCERYLKHLINYYMDASNLSEMRTHSIKMLLKFVTTKFKDLDIDKSIVMRADGYYIKSRYPGDDSFFASKQDVLDAFAAVEETKNAVDKYLKEHRLNDLESLSLF